MPQISPPPIAHYVSLIFSIMAIAIILISCIHELASLGVFGADDGVLGLAKRALGARDTSGTIMEVHS